MLDVRRKTAMRQHHALGQRRGAGGVLNEGDVVQRRAPLSGRRLVVEIFARDDDVEVWQPLAQR